MNRNPIKKKKIYILAGTLSCIGCLVMMAFPSIALSAAQKGITLWASSVLPALLPFFICANFMTALGLPAYIGRIFEKPFQKLFGAPGVSAFIFSISITSGYPMGAKLIGDFGRSGAVTRNEARQMLTFCSTSGPLFMLGAVGAGMLASPAAGAVIALSHYIGALLNGLIYRLFLSNKPGVRGVSATGRINITKGSLLELFTDSMISSFRSLGIICGYIVLFMMITDFIQYSGVLEPLRTDYGRSFIKGCLEMTVGCSGIADSAEANLLFKCVLCSFLISFGGISVYAQSMSMLSGLNIGSVYYFITKLSHGVLAGAVALFVGPHLLNMEILEAWTLQREELVKSLGFIYQLLFSTKMVIMVVFLFLATILLDKLIRRIHERFRNHSGV
jgi:sporulation integral membrane protein YlbJ